MNDRQGENSTTVLFILITLLAGCAYQNPNVNTYAPPRYAPPDPHSRSFLGYDPVYERRLIDHYVATHPREVSEYRRTYGW